MQSFRPDPLACYSPDARGVSVDTVRLARGGLEPVKRVGEAVDLGYHEEFEEVAVLGGEGRGGGGGGGGHGEE